MSGDPVCGNCGQYHSTGFCPVTNTSIYPPGHVTIVPKNVQYFSSVSTVPPSTVPLPEHMSKEQLCDILARYLGDEVFAQRFADCMTMIRQKNADYTQGVAKRDRIAAFRRIGGDIDVPMTKVWAIFAQKHWGAVMKFVKDGQVESEPIDGRINDLINYFVLLGAIVHDKGEP